MTSNEKQASMTYPMPDKWARLAYMFLAYIATAFGIAGAFLPILPTTPFDQPQFARLINDWHQQGAVPLSAKWLATIMMIGSLLTLITTESHWMIVLGMGLFFLCIGGFLWSRPNPQRQTSQ